MNASGVDVHPRQAAGGIWSYFGFNNSSAGTRNRRASSVSLPTRNTGDDPFEKADRHTSNSSDAGEFAHEGAGPVAWMNHGQRARYLKWGGLITLIIFVFVYLAPGERARVGSLVGGKLC
jgi:guanosine-diphosphatase